MDREGWKTAILRVRAHHQRGTSLPLEKLAEMLAECEDARQRLRDAYGLTDAAWPALVDAIVAEKK
jgi:hypothetical protein